MLIYDVPLFYPNGDEQDCNCVICRLTYVDDDLQPIENLEGLAKQSAQRTLDRRLDEKQRLADGLDCRHLRKYVKFFRDINNYPVKKLEIVNGDQFSCCAVCVGVVVLPTNLDSQGLVF
jgi:hypothetical protein